MCNNMALSGQPSKIAREWQSWTATGNYDYDPDTFTKNLPAAPTGARRGTPQREGMAVP